jgi:hypothetical protein
MHNTNVKRCHVVIDTFDYPTICTKVRELAQQENVSINQFIVKVEVDVEELLAWCRAQGRDVDGETRARYAAVMLRQRYEGTQ